MSDTAHTPWSLPFPDYVGCQYFKSSFDPETSMTTYIVLIGETFQIDGDNVRFEAETYVADATGSWESSKECTCRVVNEGKIDLKKGVFRATETSVVNINIPDWSTNSTSEYAMDATSGFIRFCSVGSWDGNMGFLFKAEPAHALVPRLLPGTARKVVEDKLLKTLPFLQADKTAYRHEIDEVSELRYSVHIKSIDNISTVNQSFTAKLTITLQWQVTFEDCVRYQMLDKKAFEERLSWQPPDLEAVNETSEGEVRIYAPSPTVDVSTEGGTSKYLASKTIKISGTFHEDLELHNFPFDVQPLTVTLRFSDPLPANIVLKQDACIVSPGGLQSSAWKFAKGSNKTVVTKHPTQFDISVEMQRQSSVIIVRVLVIMLILQALTFFSFAIDPVDGLSDRLSLTFTMVLTAVAYSLVVQSFLPEIGYLTFLDKYILGTFTMMAFAAGAMMVSFEVPRHFEEYDVHHVDWWCMLCSACTMSTFNIISFGHVAWNNWKQFYANVVSVVADAEADEASKAAQARSIASEDEASSSIPLMASQ